MDTLTSAATGHLIWDLQEQAEADLRVFEAELGVTQTAFLRELKKLPVRSRTVSGQWTSGWIDKRKRWPAQRLFDSGI